MSMQTLMTQHDFGLIALALVICISGSLIAVNLWSRAAAATAQNKPHWSFLAGMAGGASVWTTHFISMLGHHLETPVSFDPELTILSIAVAIVGVSSGIFISAFVGRIELTILGGAIVGAAISAMHYVGMAAYRIDATVLWNEGLVALSIACAVLASVAAALVVRNAKAYKLPIGTLLFVAAIITLHFTGMMAFTVVDISTSSPSDVDQFNAMASAIAICMLLIIGTGLSTRVLTDRTDARAAKRLRHQAMHDMMTGLPNRRHFHERLADTFREAKTTHAGVTLFMIDLDDFKTVNDALGHAIGDELLRRVGDRLEAVLDGRGMCARFGGDEFAVALPKTKITIKIDELAALIIEVLSRPYLIEGHVVEVGASIGIVCAPEFGSDANELIQNADVALYAAKDAGRKTYQTFHPDLMAEARARRSLEADVRRGLARDEFAVHFQPLKDSASGQFCGAEALVRWNNAERGPVSPAEFIPLMERTGLIKQLGERILRMACEVAATWPATMHISVNVSPIQLESPSFASFVFATLEKTGLAASRLELEITETTLLIDSQTTVKTLGDLHRGGVRITLDDFGTGFSSMTYLVRHPISRLKIDKSFFNAPNDAVSKSLVRAIAQFGNNIGIAVTAEGIETDEQADFAAHCGCCVQQGYFHARPMPPADLPHDFLGVDRTQSAA